MAVGRRGDQRRDADLAWIAGGSRRDLFLEGRSPDWALCKAFEGIVLQLYQGDRDQDQGLQRCSKTRCMNDIAHQFGKPSEALVLVRVYHFPKTWLHLKLDGSLESLSEDSLDDPE